MSARTWAGVLLVLAPIWFNTWFAVLAKRFEYPDVLRRPPAEILSRFRDGGSGLILTWWAFMLSGLLLIPTVVVVGNVVAPTGGTLIAVAIVVGVLAGLVQMLGLLRWVYLVPWLARAHAEAKPEDSARSRSRSRRSTGSSGSAWASTLVSADRPVVGAVRVRADVRAPSCPSGSAGRGS